MHTDQRKAPRRPMRYSAWVALPAKKLHGCALSDISDTGARIDVEDSSIVPDRFPLFLSSNGAARRVCTVVWRKPRQIGVTFATRLTAADRTKLTQMEADAAPLAPGETAEPATTEIA
jgi:PilZ domain-containing protein